jgi:hypothetical protein
MPMILSVEDEKKWLDKEQSVEELMIDYNKVQFSDCLILLEISSIKKYKLQ